MKVSVIIRSFNEERHIGRLLAGIERQQVLSDAYSVETIVVDSGSADATVSIAAHMGAKIIHISKEKFSFGRALNKGCEAATGDILLFASAHVYPVYTDWIEKMVRPFKDEKVALVYGRQIGNEITKFSEHEVFAKWFPPQSNYNQLNPFCNNANCAIRKTLWELQSYDEYLTGLEDLDWANRILNKGFRIAYEAEAPIVHVHEETSLKIRNRYQREAIALKHIMPHVSFTWFDFVRLFIFNSFSDIFHALSVGKFLKEIRNILSFRYNQFYGTYLGHKQKGEIPRELKTRFYYPSGIARKKDLPVEAIEHSKKIVYE